MTETHAPHENATGEPDFASYTRDHWSCLLYIETVVVDHRGVADSRQMNTADRKAADQMERDGLITWGGTGLHPVFGLTEGGWAVAHALRRHWSGERQSHWPSTGTTALAALAAWRRAVPSLPEGWEVEEPDDEDTLARIVSEYGEAVECGDGEVFIRADSRRCASVSEQAVRYALAAADRREVQS